MEWIRQGIQRIKDALGLGRNFSSENFTTTKETVANNNRAVLKYNIKNDTEGESVIVNIFGLTMRPRKDCKIRNREVAKSAEEILKIKKPHHSTFKSPIVRPVRVRKGSSWMHRLLSSSSTSASSSDQDILDYIRVSVNNDVEKPVWKTYASKFLNREHFNFVGSDKNLGPVVISIKYPNSPMIKSDDLRATLDKKFLEKTFLILRLSSGIFKRSWNQFQLSNPTMKPPLYLSKLSFPCLNFTYELLPVLCPDIGEIIAKYDETSEIDDKNSEVVGERSHKFETSSKAMKLKLLQENLITSTCKFLELSEWDFDAYRNFCSEKKSSLPKYWSFNLPLTLKTPKMCSKLAKKVKSPNFMSLPKKILTFDDEAHIGSPPDLENFPEDDDSLAVGTMNNDQADKVGVLAGQMIKPRDEKNSTEHDGTKQILIIESNETDLVKNLQNLQLEKEQILKSNSLLEKEKKDLISNERRLVRELATAQTIINSLKKRLITS